MTFLTKCVGVLVYAALTLLTLGVIATDAHAKPVHVVNPVKHCQHVGYRAQTRSGVALICNGHHRWQVYIAAPVNPDPYVNS
jgi:hypothetical protein